MRSRVLLLVLVVLVASAAVPSAVAQSGRRATVDVQVLAINDFHGALEASPSSTIRTPDGTSVLAGGAAYLATHIDALRRTNRNTAVISAGDLVGASPLTSALFHDEPTIEALNLIGLDFNAVGNHEFDEGAAELRRLQEGGCHPVDGCQDGTGFAGADFRFLAANVIDTRSGRPIFAPYEIRRYNGEQVAFIGMTLEGTPSIVSPSGIEGLEFRDEADTVNALVPELQRRGVESFVVVVHEGGVQPGGFNECQGISGPIVDIVNRFDDAVDAVVTGHTHQAYNCVVDGKLVTSASSNGRLVTDIELRVDRRSGDVTSFGADNLIVTREVPATQRVQALVDRYRELAAPLANRVIGQTTAPISRTANPAGESALGDVIADAQLAATREASQGGAVVAFMNPGGIRADLDAGDLTYNEAFTVQPFGNSLVTMTLTGAQIDTLLEQQFTQATPRILQPSAGFAYTWSQGAPAGAKIDPASITIAGQPIDPAGSYRVTVNSFLADGGDNFAVLREGTDRLGGPLDLDAFEAYLQANSPVPPGPQNRITVVG